MPVTTPCTLGNGRFRLMSGALVLDVRPAGVERIAPREKLKPDSLSRFARTVLSACRMMPRPGALVLVTQPKGIDEQEKRPPGSMVGMLSSWNLPQRVNRWLNC